MPTLKISNQQRSLAGNAMHSGTKAVQQAAVFVNREADYREARSSRDQLSEMRESGNVVLAILVITAILGLSVGSYYLGQTIWGELLSTYDALGQKSNLLAGVISVVVTMALVLSNILLHAQAGRSFDEAGFSGSSESGGNWVLFAFIFLRIGMGVLAWWLLMISLSAYPGFKMSYSELTYVAADLLLTVGEWMLSRWMGRHGITNIQYGLAGIRLRIAERGMNRSSESAYERFYEQRRYITLHNDNGFRPVLVEQGSPSVERAINYHMGMHQESTATEAEDSPIPEEPEPEAEPPQEGQPEAANPEPAQNQNIDDDLNNIVNDNQEEEGEMTMDDYIREQEQRRTDNLFH